MCRTQPVQDCCLDLSRLFRAPDPGDRQQRRNKRPVDTVATAHASVNEWIVAGPNARKRMQIAARSR
jgi:hypothetical protein